MKMTFQIFQIPLAQVGIKNKTLFKTFNGSDFIQQTIFIGPFMFLGYTQAHFSKLLPAQGQIMDHRLLIPIRPTLSGWLNSGSLILINFAIFA